MIHQIINHYILKMNFSYSFNSMDILAALVANENIAHSLNNITKSK